MEPKIISLADVGACPILSLSADHYRADGSCLCVPECDHRHGPDLCIFDLCCRCGQPTRYR